MAYLIYVLVKLACYAGWCWLGLRLWRPASATPLRAFGFGLLRLAIGVGFGVAIFILVRAQRDDLVWKYIEIYAPVRLLEWLILALIIRRQVENKAIWSALPWCLGGIVVSFAADLASPEGLAGHFCIGRCLC
jgi:hypothetical protein